MEPHAGSPAGDGQMKGVHPSCLCDCSLFWSKGVLEGRKKFLKAYSLPQPQMLPATEAAM